MLVTHADAQHPVVNRLDLSSRAPSSSPVAIPKDFWSANDSVKSGKVSLCAVVPGEAPPYPSCTRKR